MCRNQCLPFLVNVDLRGKAGLHASVAEGVLQIGVAKREVTKDVGGLWDEGEVL